MISVKVDKILSDTLVRIKEYQSRKYEKFSNWILAGSGNFEKTKDDGRYRLNCNTYRGTITCETHKIKGLKVILNHCNKLDCETCFTHATSQRTRVINEKFIALKKKAEEQGINVGKIIHYILTPVKKLTLISLNTYNNFLKLRKNVIEISEDIGIFAGIIIFHLWSLKCEICGKEQDECICSNKNLVWSLNPHFHIVGYGYLLNTLEFRNKYQEWICRNHGRRENAYHTIFYLLSHATMWRKSDGKLKPAYEYFGYMNPNKLIPINDKIQWRVDKCPECKKARKRVIDGVHLEGDHPRFKGSVPLNLQAKNLAIRTNKLPIDKIKQAINQCVYKNANFSILLSEENLKLGYEYKYKIIVRDYKLEGIEELRKIVRGNRVRYREDVKRHNKKNLEERSEYG